MSNNSFNYTDYEGAWRPLNGRPALRVAVWPKSAKARKRGAYPTAYRLHAPLCL